MAALSHKFRMVSTAVGKQLTPRSYPLPKVIVPTFTAFNRDGTLNPSAIPKQATYIKKTGADLVYVNGTTGEGLSQSVAERKIGAEAWVKHGKPELTVVIHIGAESLVDARELAAHAESIGADGIAALAPSYFRPATVDALVDWLAEVAAAAPRTPFYYYHFPGMNNVTHKPSAVLLAARKSGKIPTLKGAKFTDIDTEDLAVCIGAGFEMWTGMGMQMGLSTLVLGAHGFFAFSYQVPSFMKLLDAWEKRDLEEAVRIQQNLIKLNTHLASHGGLPAFKALKSHLVVDVGDVRLPLKPISEEARKSLIDGWAGVRLAE